MPLQTRNTALPRTNTALPRTKPAFRAIFRALLMCAALLTMPPATTPAYAQNGICDRTPQVRDAILQQLPVSDCAAVTAAHLAGIKELRLRNNRSGSVKAGDFTGLAGLALLDLHGNRLTSVPKGVFDDLMNLNELDLSNNLLASLPVGVFANLNQLKILWMSSNSLTSLPDGVFARGAGAAELRILQLHDSPGTSFNLPLQFVRTDGGANIPGRVAMAVQLPAGAPTTVSVTVSVQGGTLSSGAVSGADIYTATIASGTTMSEQFTIAQNSNSVAQATLTATAGPLPRSIGGQSTRYRGFSISAATTTVFFLNGICGHTQQVRDEIMRLSSVGRCADVTATHLSKIRQLHLQRKNITTLKSGDFAGITNLLVLHLHSNNLTGLPKGVFSGLGKLTTLSLFINRLGRLPDGIFDDLRKLTHLNLNHSQITGLPNGVFNNLHALTHLELQGNKLANLPHDVFVRNAGASALTRLDLHGNPSVVFALPLQIVRTDAAANAPGPATVAVRLSAGAPAPLSVTLSAQGGTLSAGDVSGVNTYTATITSGATMSESVTVKRAPLALEPATLKVTPVPLPHTLYGKQTKYTGFTFSTGASTVSIFPQGVCKRTPQVRDEIVRRLSVRNCADVTEEHLAGIKELNLQWRGITALKADDFTGLTGLTLLNLHRNQLTRLPNGVFADLVNVNELDLSANRLGRLPSKVFANLKELTVLRLFSNPLTSLPAGIFVRGADAAGLHTLQLHDTLGAPFSMPLQIVRTNADANAPGPATVTVQFPSGAPANLFVTLFVQGGTLSAGDVSGASVYTATIRSGTNMSDPVTVVQNPDTHAQATLTVLSAPLPGANYSGATIPTGASIKLFPAGICSRTQQVLAEIIRLLPVDDCADVTTAHLAGITDSLNLSAKNITALKPFDFFGLTNLRALSLHNNRITGLPSKILGSLRQLTKLQLHNNLLRELPDGLWARGDGAAAMSELNLSGNPGANFTLPLQLMRTDATAYSQGPATIAVSFPAGAPAPLSVTLSVQGGAFSADSAYGASTHITTIASGATMSKPVIVKQVLSTLEPATLTATAAPLPRTLYGKQTSYQGIATSSDATLNIFPKGICDHTPQVRNEIVQLSPVNNCTDVTAAHLAEIEELNLPSKGITALKSGDFAGLSGLTLLNLKRNRLTTLPRGVFDGLDSLVELSLVGNHLTGLPNGVFNDLVNLNELDLSANRLASLPNGVFANLKKLEILWMSSNALTSLPSGVFVREAGAADMHILQLHGTPGADFNLPLQFVRTDAEANEPGPATVAVKLPAGAPAKLSVTLSALGGTLSAGAVSNAASYTATIASGATMSEAVTVMQLPNADAQAVLTISDATLARPAAGKPVFRDGFIISTDASIELFPRLGVCSRTTEVRYAITRLAPVDDCADVTAAHLAGIADVLNLQSSRINELKAGDFTGLVNLDKLYLYNNFLQSLPEGVFSDLGNLTQLLLSNNRLTSLPDGVFGNLSALTHLVLHHNALTSLPNGVFARGTGATEMEFLYLRDNPGADFTLPLQLVRTDAIANAPGPATMAVQFPAGAPKTLSVTLSVQGGSFSGGGVTGAGTYTATIESGATMSELFTVAKNTDVEAPATLQVTGTPPLTLYNDKYNGFVIPYGATIQIFPPGICSYTQQVRDKLVLLLPVNDCADVTDEHLAGFAGVLDLSEKNITVLKSHDFAKLAGVTGISLSGNQLESVPENLFDGAGSLRALNLSGNSLSSLPMHVFDSLGSLTYLNLSHNDLESLPEDMFVNLGDLTELHLTANLLSNLPDDLFAILGSLTELHAGENQLTALPEKVFVRDSGAASLRKLFLHDNPGATFTLPMQLIRTNGENGAPGPAVMAVHFPEGAPATLSVTLSARGGTLSAATVGGAGTYTATIASGATVSERIMVMQHARSEMQVVVEVTAAPLPDEYRGVEISPAAAVTLFPRGICGRTKAVRDAIVHALPVNDCAQVTAAHLAGLAGSLSLSAKNISALKPLDFAGLKRLQRLHLNANQLESLPGGVFDDLENLFRLYLNGNQLTTLPAGVFNKLGRLTRLYLQDNQLTALRSGVFRKLINMSELYLQDNQLRALPRDVFARDDGAVELHDVDLSGNPAAFTLQPHIARTDANFDALGPAEVAVSFPAGAPAKLSVDLSVRGGTFSGGSISGVTTYTATIAAGATMSELVSVEQNPHTEARATLRINNVTPPGIAYYSNLTIAAGATAELFPRGICGRTQQVRDAIVSASPPEHCAEVTAEHLAEIDGALELQSANIGALKTIDFAGLDAVTKLNLSENRLATLPDNVFAGLGALAELNLNGNLLTELSPGAFATLTALATLHLNGNQLAALPPAVFANYEALTELHLDGNRLTEWPGAILARPQNMRKLHLHANQLPALPQNALAPFTNLSSLHLSGNQLKEFPRNMFARDDATALRYLHLRDNPGAAFTFALKLMRTDADADAPGPAAVTVLIPDGAPAALSVTLSVSRGVFAGGAQSYTATIAAAGTVSEEFIVAHTAQDDTAVLQVAATSPPGESEHYSGFVYAAASAELFPNLRDICARTRQVREAIVAALPGAASAGCAQVQPEQLRGIRELNLSAREITALRASDFSGLINMRTLNLADNQLAELPPRVFHALESLQNLHLQKNSLRELPRNVFANLANLQTLYLHENLLHELPQAAFAALTNLRQLRLNQNMLDAPPLGVFSALAQLQTLDLAQNRLATLLDESVFTNLAALKELRLNQNRLMQLPGATVFATLTTLTYLNLADNEITALPPGVFNNVSALTTLQLDANRLTQLRGGVFDQLTLLQELGIAGNLLPQLPPAIFDKLTKLKTLRISDNPLRVLADGVFKNLTALAELHARANNLSAWPQNALATIPGLRILDIGGNRFRELPQEMFIRENAAALRVFDVSENQPANLALPLQILRIDGKTGSASPGKIVVEIAAGAPTTMQVALTADGGMLSLGDAPGARTYAATIAAGKNRSEEVTVKRDAAATSPAEVRISGTILPKAIGAETTTYAGFTTPPAGALRIFPNAGLPRNVGAGTAARQITIIWLPALRNTADITGYSVRWRRAGTPYSRATLPATATRHTITNLINGVAYDVEVAARTAGGDGQFIAAQATPARFTLDIIAGDGNVFTRDYILLRRYADGVRGFYLVQGHADVEDATLISARIEAGIASGDLDVDASGGFDADDATLMTFYFLGLRDADLSAFKSSASSATAQQIERNIRAILP